MVVLENKNSGGKLFFDKYCPISYFLPTAQEILEDYMFISYFSVILEILESLKGTLWNKCCRTNMLVKKRLYMTTYVLLDATLKINWHVNDFLCVVLRNLVPFVKNATLLRVTLLRGCFSRFLNCENVTKSRKASPVMSWTLYERYMIAIWTSFGHYAYCGL